LRNTLEVMRMLGLWTRNFRGFLDALDGADCPLCAVVDEAVRNHLRKIANRRWPQRHNFCGTHLAILLDFTSGDVSRVSAVQNALQASITVQTSRRTDSCELCALSRRLTNRLARMIAAMEDRIRFEKALQSGPLVCSAHIRQVLGAVRAERFAQIEHKQVEALITEIGQSRLRGSADLQDLIAMAISYLGSADRERAASIGLDARGRGADAERLAAAAQAEFAGWDEAKRLAHLSDVESEVASLRYRNGVLSEENRRLKLAHTASEAMRHDLERDRKELLAAVKNSRSSKISEKS
jgi:hypothetical protein